MFPTYLFFVYYFLFIKKSMHQGAMTSWFKHRCSGSFRSTIRVSTMASQENSVNFFLSMRFRISILMMLCLFCATSMRMDMGMAVVCMVNTTAFDGTNSSRQADYNGDLLWSPRQVSLILSGTFYGALATVWWSGYLADRFGAKFVLLVGVLELAGLTLAVPLLSGVGYWSVLAGRLAMGFGEGLIFPGLSSMAARWFPPFERSTFAAIYTSGNQLAGILSMSTSSLLCSSPLGWPSIFYLFGGLGCLWAVFWCVLASDAPEANPFITQSEIDHIRSSAVGQHTNTKTSRLATHAVPWLKIATSTAVYANLYVQWSFHFSASLIQTYLPTYMRQVLHVDLTSNGLFTMMPFLAQLISKYFFGPLADSLKKKGILTNTQACKLFQILGNGGGGLCFLILGYFVNKDRLLLAIITLTCYGVFFSLGICGFFTSILSIAPPFTGLIMSLGTLCGTAGGAMAPTFVGHINQHGTLSEWQIILVVTSVINFSAAIVYFIFGSADIQPWAVPPQKGSGSVVAELGALDEPVKKPLMDAEAEALDEEVTHHRPRLISEVSVNEFVE